jgi:microcystin degradation protein MlrC
MHDTGLRAGRAVLALLAGKARPTMAWGRQPMLPHVMRQGTDDSPNRELQLRCREIEAQGALCASVFVGFPNADIECAGLSAVVVTDNDAALNHRRVRSSSIGPSRWRSRCSAPVRWRRPSPRAADRSCCSTTATTAPPAARWTR